jgi:hypothetical protein
MITLRYEVSLGKVTYICEFEIAQPLSRRFNAQMVQELFCLQKLDEV